MPYDAGPLPVNLNPSRKVRSFSEGGRVENLQNKLSSYLDITTLLL